MLGVIIANVQEIVLSNPQLDWCQQILAATADAGAPKIDGITALRVEASHRQFYRLHYDDQSTLVFMNSPPQLENNTAFTNLAEAFADHSLPVPRILGADMVQGWFLMTDLGSTHLADVYNTKLQQPALETALATLIPLSQVRSKHIGPYSRQRMWDELVIFKEWLLEAYLQVPSNAALDEALNMLVDATQVQPQCCVHRDYHCRNLLFEHGNLGIVDFQDALMGPVLYDPASLLRDCYHRFPETTVRQWLSHYASRQPLLVDIDPMQLTLWFDYTALQRQLKALGIFARLMLRDGKDTHLQHIRPVLVRMQDLTKSYPNLEPIFLQLSDCISAWDSRPTDTDGH